MDDFKITLKAARINAGMTLEDVAKEMKVGKATIMKWEKNEKAPKPSEFYFLSRLYGVPEDYIFLP